MADLPSASEITGLVGLLAPGLLILGIRARFKDGKLPGLKDQVIGYGVASTAYYAAAYPLFHVERYGLPLPVWLWGLCQYFLLPCVVALAIVWFDQTEWLYRWTSKAGLRLSHHIPAAWDYAFSHVVKGTFVLVKLNDGTLYAGKMASKSFASSSVAERELYLEEVWNMDSSPWSLVQPKRGVLLCGKDIRWVEIFERS